MVDANEKFLFLAGLKAQIIRNKATRRKGILMASATDKETN